MTDDGTEDYTHISKSRPYSKGGKYPKHVK